MGYGALAAVGGLMQLGSAFTGARAARRRVNQLEGIAATPGLDTGDIGLEAIMDQESAFGPASVLTDKINRFNAGQRQSLLDDAIPGYESRKNTSADLIDSFLRGEVPQDVQDQIWNSAAGRALGGGYGGSGLGRNLTARDLGLTSLGLAQTGLQESGRFNRETAGLELPEMANVARYLGLSPQELVALRSGERTERMRYQALAAGAPQGREVWAKYLNDVGGQMGGLGVSGILGGINGGSPNQTTGAGAGHGIYGDW